jgi:hypothetical protein
VSIAGGRDDETDFAGKSSSVFGIEDGRATTDKRVAKNAPATTNIWLKFWPAEP